MEDKCSFPRCRDITSLRYIGHDLCEYHWQQLAESEGKTEKRLLKKIGLERNKKGQVVKVGKNEKENQLEKDME